MSHPIQPRVAGWPRLFKEAPFKCLTSFSSTWLSMVPVCLAAHHIGAHRSSGRRLQLALLNPNPDPGFHLTLRTLSVFIYYLALCPLQWGSFECNDA